MVVVTLLCYVDYPVCIYLYVDCLCIRIYMYWSTRYRLQAAYIIVKVRIQTTHVNTAFKYCTIGLLLLDNQKQRMGVQVYGLIASTCMHAPSEAMAFALQKHVQLCS